LTLSLNASYTKSEAGLAPFLLMTPDQLAGAVFHALTMERVSAYSDLYVTDKRLGLEARYQIRQNLWIQGAWEYGDYSDDAPYLYDQSGKAHFYTFGAGLTF